MLLLSCWGVVSSKLTHLHLYFHEVDAGAPNATIVNVSSLHILLRAWWLWLPRQAGARRRSPFGDVNVFDNELREGPDPASRLIGRAQGFAVNASLDGSSILSAIDFVFSGSTLTTQGQFDPAGGPSERSIVGGTGKLRFARGYMTSRLLSSTNTTIVVVFDMYFTLPH
ncbi:Disease resistance response protein-like [Zea mays]|uniref:Dirigent protein n=1 Tax=Zea mays TaxID=4577 RepID=A0A1D6JH94_MAIZE|nr:Disease resistance response protein-like [Zea mays]